MPRNVAIREANLGAAYCSRAEKAHAANDLDREQANLELALPHYREAVRIYRAINHMDTAGGVLRRAVDVEEKLLIARAAVRG